MGLVVRREQGPRGRCGAVAVALVATAVGLFAAIPAVLGYNLLVRRLRRLMIALEGAGVQLLNEG